MTEQRHELSDEDIWFLMNEGCNANEIAHWAGISVAVARARMGELCAKHARGDG